MKASLLFAALVAVSLSSSSWRRTSFLGQVRARGGAAAARHRLVTAAPASAGAGAEIGRVHHRSPFPERRLALHPAAPPTCKNLHHDPDCDDNDDCVVVDGNGNGVCVMGRCFDAKREIGEECDDSDDCAGGSDRNAAAVCVKFVCLRSKRKRVGQACDHNADCEAALDLTCVNGVCLKKHTHAASAKASSSGEHRQHPPPLPFCDDSADCTSGNDASYYCNDSGACVPRLLPGGNDVGSCCSENYACQSVVCVRGRCLEAPAADGQPCDDSLDCTSRVCGRRSARDPYDAIGIGGVGQYDSHDGTSFACQPGQLSAGDACSGDLDCRSYVCVAGRCRAGLRRDGDACGANLHCHSRTCVSGRCKEKRQPPDVVHAHRR